MWPCPHRHIGVGGYTCLTLRRHLPSCQLISHRDTAFQSCDTTLTHDSQHLRLGQPLTPPQPLAALSLLLFTQGEHGYDYVSKPKVGINLAKCAPASVDNGRGQG